MNWPVGGVSGGNRHIMDKLHMGLMSKMSCNRTTNDLEV